MTSLPSSVLFERTGSPSDVTLNWFGHPVGRTYTFAGEYWRAAKMIVQASSAEELRDIGACPVVFLYRHSLELYLKEILFTGGVLISQSADPRDVPKLGHDLEKLLNSCDEILRAAGATDALASVAPTIREFSRTDAGSFAFRYPVDRLGNQSLKGNARQPLSSNDFSFNLDVFCTRMDAVLNTLDSLCHAVETTVALMREEHAHQF